MSVGPKPLDCLRMKAETQRDLMSEQSGMTENWREIR